MISVYIRGKEDFSRLLFTILLFPDGSDPLSPGKTGRDGIVAWSEPSSGGDNIPCHVHVVPDDRIYITDWADAHASLRRSRTGLFTNNLHSIEFLKTSSLLRGAFREIARRSNGA